MRSWQTDSSVVSSLQQYIKTWHQLASACWWNKHPPSHSLVGELPHAVKLFLHCLSPFSSSSWVSMYVWKKKKLIGTSLRSSRKEKKKSCALRRSHCDRKQLELSRTHYSSAVRPVTLTKDKRERKKQTKKTNKTKPQSQMRQFPTSLRIPIASNNHTSYLVCGWFECSQWGRKKEVPLLPYWL